MYCIECGTETSSETKFCPQCGTAQSAGHVSTATAVKEPEPAQVVDSSEPLLVTRPVFVPWVVVAGIVPIQIFMTIWGGGFFGGFSMFAVKALGLNLPAWFTFVFFGAVFFFGLPLLAYVASKRTCAETEYRFYRDRLEYAEGFWTAEQKSIKYSDVKEVHLRRGVVQRKYGLGTIQLSTASASAMSGSNRSFSGIRVHNVPDAEQIYGQVKELIG
ncbi:MAG: PH domain-containing protein [Phycisphaerales bacterium]|nr:MAG: PH domain-containing protein [Phycisphaerales bacterium]